MPSAGTGGTNGFELATPYYLNLAPNYDATITPRYMSKRGLMMEGSGRYLFTDLKGDIAGSFLPSDSEAGRDRNSLSFTQSGAFTSRWSHYLTFNRVSDDAYFEDFGDGINDVSTTHLQRLANTTYNGDNWRLMGQVEEYQTLTGTKPYQRLPQILFNTAGFAPGGFAYQFDSEYAVYNHPDLVDGSRVDLYPSLSYPFERAAFRIEPRVGFRYTQYQLNHQLAGLDDAPTRTLPILSLDSGLFFRTQSRSVGRKRASDAGAAPVLSVRAESQSG